MVKIGICGFGFVGSAINNFFVTKHEILIYDKYKNINTFNILLESDILFICLPTNIENKDDLASSYDLLEIDNTINLLNNKNFQGIIIIKSTVLPLYCQEINNKYPDLKIIHNPEFLSARTANQDFTNQKHIILGYTKQSFDVINIIYDFYQLLFPNVLISITTSEESSLVKLGCNSFYAMKIQFFTELFLLCKKMNLDYDNVKNMMLKNDWINPMHTLIPGHDGQISYGGSCLPKDIQALSNFMNQQEVSNLVLDAVIKDNKKTRNE
jgi:UDPglucose 6-dehydrogenase